jgi:poly-beta-1,6-N-acetyl-D-glucosamine synthase
MTSLAIAVVVPFLDEEWCLPTFLESMALQTRAPDLLVLVDDGSTDRSGEIAEAFAAGRDQVIVLHRPARPATRDRLAQAAELNAFQWAVGQVDARWDVVAKMDADLELPPAAVATLAQAFERESELGMAGLVLYERDAAGVPVSEASPRRHIRGATKFYRRACWERIAPLPEILGWDTLDEFLARAAGWRTESFEVPDGRTLHLRRVGGHGPILRSFRRWGACSFGYGAHPVYVLLYAGILMRRRRPHVIGGVNFLIGWTAAALRGAPRADARVRQAVQRDQLARIKARLAGRPLLDALPQPLPELER